MALPEKDDKAFKNLWDDPNNDMTYQERYDAMMQGLLEDPSNTFEVDPNQDATTPQEFRNGTKWAQITDYPTTTSNPNRPRTIGAGYDKRLAILTVQFRDGTLYNYYDVPEDMWLQFKNASSKGKFMQKELDAWASKGKVSGQSTKYYNRKARSSIKSQKQMYTPIDEWK